MHPLWWVAQHNEERHPWCVEDDMQSCVSPVSYRRLHRLSDASALRLSCVVVWQIIVVPKLSVVFWDERVNFFFDGTKKIKKQNRWILNTSISELHHIPYSKQLFCLVQRVQKVHMHGLQYLNDQPRKTVVKQYASSCSVFGVGCSLWSGCWHDTVCTATVVDRDCATSLAGDVSGQL